MPLFPPTTAPTPLPSGQNLLAWSTDPATAAGGVATSAGALYTVRIVLPAAATITKLWVVLTAAGGTLTSGQNFLGLYNAAGSKVAATGDQTTAFASAGPLGAALTGSYVAAAGNYWVGVLCNGGTPITLASTSGIAAGATAIGNTGQVAANGYRYGFAATGQTTLPASFDPTTIIPNITANFWAAVG